MLKLVSRRRALVRARWAEWTFGVGLLLYMALAVLAHRYAYFAWDVTVAHRIQSITAPGFESLMFFLSELGSGWAPVVLVGATGALLALKGLRLEALIAVAGPGLGLAMNSLLKAIIGRPRPPETLVHVVERYAYFSFPSGHVTFYVEFFGFLLFLCFALLRREALRWATVAVLGGAIALIGVSRVYMGAHWPSDVAGAYLAGGIWLLGMIEVYRRRTAGQKDFAATRSAGRGPA